MNESRLGDFEEVLLLLVGILGDDAYAFKLEDEYAAQTGRSSSIGAIHSTLTRLEKKGYLDSYMGDPSAKRGGRRKRIYAITALGHRVLSDNRNLKLALWNQFPGLAKN
ncbi:MAG: PadR family transcriptional regulator [Saprospiraceae bacterium]|nr:PadR family transcriptional regulator [Saprospiraceae bacterium]